MSIEPAPGERAMASLRSLTPARVGLGRRGTSLPTDALLRLRTDQIQAAASVRAPLDVDALVAQVRQTGAEVLVVNTLAADREDYLKHPDRGRTLAADSREQLHRLATDPAWDVVFVISEGLSTEAAQTHAAGLLAATREALFTRDPDLRIAPVVIAPRARVGLLNDVGAAIGARIAVILLGERPGLSSSDGLSAYLEFGPREDLTDADRNCISNIRPGGLDQRQAAANLASLVLASSSSELSGVGLKVEFAARPAVGVTPRSV